jgi:hypothetical protein
MRAKGDPRFRHDPRSDRRLRLRLEDRGLRKLKGIQDQWRLFAVRD